MSYTRPLYDDAQICWDYAANQKMVDYNLDPIANEATTGCLEPAGLPATSLNSASIMPTKGGRVTLEGILRGQTDEIYSRDSVNEHIDAFEKDLVAAPNCSRTMEPIQTRLGCPGTFEYDRIFNIGIVPQHPWERSMGPSLNSREITREVYEDMNPFGKGSCGGVLRTK